MSISKRNQFDGGSHNNYKCSVYNRPLADHETFVFRLATIEKGEKGHFDVAEGVITDCAQELGWHSPAEYEYMQSCVEESKAEAHELNLLLAAADGGTLAIRALSRELDHAQAVQSDAVAQVNELTKQLEHLEDDLAETTAERDSLQEELEAATAPKGKK